MSRKLQLAIFLLGFITGALVVNRLEGPCPGEGSKPRVEALIAEVRP
jgi:hypothetical protein